MCSELILRHFDQFGLHDLESYATAQGVAFLLRFCQHLCVEESPKKTPPDKLQNREITIINRTEPSRQSKLESWVKIASSIATPVVIAVLGIWIQSYIARDVARQEYVKLAVAILREKPDVTNKPLRGWAVRLLNGHSIVKLDPVEQEALRTGEALLPVLTDESGRPISDERGRLLTADATNVTADSTKITADLPMNSLSNAPLATGQIGQNIPHHDRNFASSSLAQWCSAGATLLAVIVALFREVLFEWLFPLRVRIVEAAQQNNFYDKLDTPEYGVCEVYCHHLTVTVQTRWLRMFSIPTNRPIRNCRVWLTHVYELVDDEWKQEHTFAVKRHMQWAPHEFSPNERTFAGKEVFDLGSTIVAHGEFRLHVKQGGHFNGKLNAGKRYRFVFAVTAENYFRDDDFSVEVYLPVANPQSASLHAQVKLINEMNWRTRRH